MSGRDIAWIIGALVGLVVVFVVLCCFRVSGECSEQERRRDTHHNSLEGGSRDGD